MYKIKWFTYEENPYDAFNIRVNVFVKEQNFDFEFDAYEKRSLHMVMYDDNLPIATGRIYKHEEKTCKIGRIAIIKSYRGKKLGYLLLSNLEQKAKSLGYDCAILGAQVQAKGFYEKTGYHAFGEEYKEEYCSHIGMIKKL